KLRPVTVSVLQGEDALIASGVQAGERVITEGQDQLKPNMKVDPSAGKSRPHGAAKEARSPQ
ncbi:MAG TPA: hypothetical protein VGI70_20285, partial [Polyangiales bacterium]